MIRTAQVGQLIWADLKNGRAGTIAGAADWGAEASRGERC